MKLPSLSYLYESAKTAFIRFPFSIICALIAVTIGVYLVENKEDIENYYPFVNIILSSSLGISLYFCADIFCQKHKVTDRMYLIVIGLITTILVCLYFTFPSSIVDYNTNIAYIRYCVYIVASHLLVSFIPFVQHREVNGFWQYNRILFIRLWISGLYAAFLYVGLVLALVALKMLFEIDIHEELYFEFYIVILGFFNTLFFLAGIPTDINQLETELTYPKGLKIFSQYILLPLLGLYLVILYAYGIQIVALWNWPKGLVSYLIICVSVLGILDFLLLHPFGNEEGNDWIKKASKGYYFALLPLLVLLFIAIGMRLGDYGITINRYLVCTLGVWLTIVCIYTAIGKTNIKFIPISLACILVIISFGPWSMFEVSESNQVGRLKKILEQSQLLENGKIKNEVVWVKDSLPRLIAQKEDLNEGKLTDSLHNEIYSILNYLDDFHDFDQINALFTEDMQTLIQNSRDKDTLRNYTEASIYMRAMGLNYQHKYPTTSQYFSFWAEDQKFSKVSGFDYVIPFNFGDSRSSDSIVEVDIANRKYKIISVYSPKNQLFLKTPSENIIFNLDSLSNGLRKDFGQNNANTVPPQLMVLNTTTPFHTASIHFKTIGFEDSSTVNRMEGQLLLRIKK